MPLPKLGLIGILGEEYKKDFWAAQQKLATLGYRGVEGVADFLVGDVAANLRRLKDLGLCFVTHGGSREALRDKCDKVLAEAVALQATHYTVWWANMDTRDSILADAELYNKVGPKFAAAGIKLCYHNHHHEFRKTFDGVYALDLLAANTDPAALSFEFDIGWVTVGGEDPVRLLKRFAGRVPAIHVKDFSRLQDPVEFSAVGTGMVDIRAALATAAEIGVAWAVVEQDKLRNLSSFETVAAAAFFLRENGLVA
jgi:sugar phosphate isomerase/epimerase